MPTGATKRPDILQVAKQLQHEPQDDPAVVESMARAVMGAVAEQGRINSLRPPGRLTRKDAAHLSAYLVASLQCAGWLQQAARAQRVPVKKATDAADAVAFLVMSAATKWVMMVDMNLDFLRAVIRPALGGTAPGIMTWLPWVAEQRLKWILNRGPPEQHPCDPVASNTVGVWVALMAASQDYSSGRVMHPAAWLAPQLVQLAHVCLLAPLGKHSPTAALLDFTAIGAEVGFTLAAHPALYTAVTGQPGDVALGATAAAALHQDFWWHSLGTCIRGLKLQSILKAGIGPVHPCVRRLAAYCSQAFSDQLVQPVAQRKLAVNAAQLVHVLLVRELWELLPWQLQWLAAHGSAVRGAGAAASEEQGGDWGSGSDTGSDSSSSSSSSSSRDGVQGREASSDNAVQESAAVTGYSTMGVQMDVPVLPQHVGEAVGSNAAGAVTLQQLQVATCAMCFTIRGGDYSAVLLLSLLLQRVDPGLRAEFLGGPCGSLMLHELSGVSRVRATPGGHPIGWLVTHPGVTPEQTRQQLVAVLNKEPLRELPMQVVTSAEASLLALVWAHLEVRPIPEGGLCHPGSSEMERVHVLGTHSGVYSTPRADLECLLRGQLPCAAFRFLPGLSPSLELFAAAERLLREQGGSITPVDLDPLLQSVAVLLHAAVNVWAPWQGQPCGTLQAGTSSIDSSSSIVNGSSSDAPPPTSTNGGSSSSSAGDSSSGGPTPNSTDGTSSSSSGGPPPTSPEGGSSSDRDVGGHASSTTASNAHSSSSSSSSRKDSGLACGPGTLQALSSLIVTMGCHLYSILASSSSSSKLDNSLLRAVEACSLIAADMMHLAAHQLQQPGANRLAVLGLAAAGQRLAAACAELGSVQMRLYPGQPEHHHNQQQQQPQPVQCGKQQLVDGEGVHEASSDPVACSDVPDARTNISMGMVNLCWGQWKLRRVLGGVPGLPGILHVTAGQETAGDCWDVPAGPAEARRLLQERFNQYVLPAMAQLQCTCRSRVQLVGCSHQRCTNLSGPSAEGLVAGRKGVRCGGCRVARYCSPACQQADWPQHRHVCRRLGAAGPSVRQAAGPEPSAEQPLSGAAAVLGNSPEGCRSQQLPGR